MTETDVQKQIEAARQGNHFFRNIYWNGTWEADLIEVNSMDFITEFEVKVSKQDFKMDLLHKEEKHNHFRTLHDLSMLPNYFNYVCPEGMIKEEEVPEYAGLMYVVKRNLQKTIWTIKKAPVLHNDKVYPDKWREIALKLSRRL